MDADGTGDARGSTVASVPSSGRRLRFRPDPSGSGRGVFKVMQVTDLHCGEHEDFDDATGLLIASLVSMEAPVDLVVISGDLASGYAKESHSLGWFEALYAKCMAPLKASGVPWTFILGNHDADGELGPDAVVKRVAQDSLTRYDARGDVDGITNYYLDVEGVDDEVGHEDVGNEDDNPGEGRWERRQAPPASRLWFLDSGSAGCEGTQGWGCVGRSAVAWFQSEARALRAARGEHMSSGRDVGFVHIPPVDMRLAWNAPENAAWGTKGEGVCCSPQDTGLVAAMRSEGVAGLFFGHDHNNDFQVRIPEGEDGLGSILLGYGRKTGFGGYGPWDRHGKPFSRGARVIELTQGGGGLDRGSGGMVTWFRDGATGQVQRPAPVPRSERDYIPFCCQRGHELVFRYVQYAFIALLVVGALVYQVRRSYAKARQMGLFLKSKRYM